MTQAQQPQKSMLIDPIRWGIIKTKALEDRACQAFALFRQNGIEPILVKGLAVGLYYPKDIFRDSVDMDIAVLATDFDAAKRVVESAAAKGLAIDLHRELRHLDTLEWQDLFLSSKLIDLDNGNIRILRAEDHLRVLCVHWLTDGGSNKDRLWDIYYALENRPADFDWDRFINVVDQKRRRWITCTIGLAHRYLGLDLTNTPLESEAKDIPKWIIKTVEKEWSTDTPFKPLFASMTEPKQLITQLKKRLPPNPITATVLVNGSFDAKTRIFYQIGTSFARIGPSIANIAREIFARIK